MTELSTPKDRRVLLQIDATTHCQQAVRAALDITARIGAELQGIFIEDADLLTVGELDFIREFRFSSPTAHQLDRLTLEGQLRAMARSVQRQLEHAARLRKVTVGFRSIRGDLMRTEDESLLNADLVIMESTGRLQNRSYRRRVSAQSDIFVSTRPILLLKGDAHLSPYVTIICDSIEAAEHGLRLVNTLLGTAPENITLLPFGLNDQEQREIGTIAGIFAERVQSPSGSAGQVNIAPPPAGNETRLNDVLLPENCLVVMKTRGLFMKIPTQLDTLILSNHPLLFVQ